MTPHYPIRGHARGRYPGLEHRVQALALAIAASFILLCLQFWNLQVLSHSHFEKMADENTVSSQRLRPNRGIIYGRNGVILANNRASADIVLIPGPGPNSRTFPSPKHIAVCKRLERLVGVSSAELLQKIRKLKREPFTQIIVKRDVSKADRVRVEEHGYALPGVFTVVHPKRRYLHGEIGGTVLGYLGEIGPEELQAKEGYSQGDLVGISGIERVFEDTLHGRDGFMVVTKYAWGRPQILTDESGTPYISTKDSRGNKIVQNSRTDAVSGNPIHLTLDIDLQAKCEALLHGEVGAIVVLEADTGAVLALASAPTYDPGIFVTRGRSRDRMGLLTAAHPNPMLARAYRENYPPGSIFKVMLASAALEEGVITEDSTFYCPGYFKLPNVVRRWHCWNRRGHGNVAIREALAFSCDVFFYNTGRALGVDRMEAWAKSMGLGIKTGIDLTGEITGLIPGRQWKKEKALLAGKPVWDQAWYPGETLNFSIGQGSATITPLQGAVMMAVIVNGGHRVTPFLNADTTPTRSQRLFGDATIALVRRGMRYCVEKGMPAPSGTGKLARIEGFDILGKTGSAQVASLTAYEKYATEEDIPYALLDHAWFVAGVLDHEPKIALCVLVEHGHHGSSAAAPLAREVIEHFYKAEAGRTLRMAKEDAPR